MTTQPKALRLADELEDMTCLWSPSVNRARVDKAAAELRRLHADNKLICSALNGWIRENSPGGWIDDLRTQRDALLEALKMIAGETPCFDNLMGDKDIARAAIKAVEETK